MQAAVVTAAKVNALSIDASAIKAGTLDVARLAAGSITAAKLDVADVQASVVTAAAVNAVAINAGSITAGTLSAARIAAGAIDASKLNVADVQAAVVTAAKVNTLALNASVIAAGTIATARLDVAAILASQITAANITGGSISGVTITGGVIRTTPTAAGKRVEISTDHTIKWYSGDAAETNPGKITATAYAGGGGYLSLSGPTVAGMAMGGYISVHGAVSRKDIILQAGPGGAGVTVGPSDEPNEVRVIGNLHVTGTYHDATVDGNLAVGGGLSAGYIYPSVDWGSGTSLDGVWIQDKTNLGTRWKVYFDGPAKKLWARAGSTYYGVVLA